MKTTLLTALLALPFLAAAQINVGGTLNDKANEKTGQAIDAVWNSPGKMKGKKGGKDQTSAPDTASQGNSSSASPATPQDQPAASQPVSIKSYQNYDFVAGTELVFFDDFATDMDGEFPSHWELDAGQGVTNKADGKPMFFLTDGNYVMVHPRITPNTYLDGDAWTIEADALTLEGDYGLVFFFFEGERQVMQVHPDGGGVSADFPKADGSEDHAGLSANLSPEVRDSYNDHWHHIAIAYKNQQLKVYFDQNRMLVVPNCHCKPTSVAFGGIGDQVHPMKFTNVRIANGGSQNMLNALNTNGKIVSYGITFDAGKSTIRPESMGTLNEVAKMMKENPAIRLEIGGHCDSDGDDASNLKLSQARADAVRTQLVSMGVDASRLTAKGYGESKPVAPNTTFEGKAKNRRVEFVKQ